MLQASLCGVGSMLHDGDVSFPASYIDTLGAERDLRYSEEKLWKQHDESLQKEVCVSGGTHRVLARREFLSKTKQLLLDIYKQLRIANERQEHVTVRALGLGKDLCKEHSARNGRRNRYRVISTLGTAGGIARRAAPQCEDSAVMHSTSSAVRNIAKMSNGGSSTATAVAGELRETVARLARARAGSDTPEVITPGGGSTGARTPTRDL